MACVHGVAFQNIAEILKQEVTHIRQNPNPILTRKRATDNCALIDFVSSSEVQTVLTNIQEKAGDGVGQLKPKIQ